MFSLSVWPVSTFQGEDWLVIPSLYGWHATSSSKCQLISWNNFGHPLPWGWPGGQDTALEGPCDHDLEKRQRSWVFRCYFKIEKVIFPWFFSQISLIYGSSAKICLAKEEQSLSKGMMDVNKLFLVDLAITVLNHGYTWGCLLQSHLHGPLAGFPVLQEGLTWEQWFVGAQSQIRSCGYSGKQAVLAAQSTGKCAAVLASLQAAQRQVSHLVQQKTSSPRSTMVVFEIMSQIFAPIWEAFLQTYPDRAKSWVFV